MLLPGAPPGVTTTMLSTIKGDAAIPQSLVLHVALSARIFLDHLGLPVFAVEAIEIAFGAQASRAAPRGIPVWRADPAPPRISSKRAG
jgi:hypothetical protein